MAIASIHVLEVNVYNSNVIRTDCSGRSVFKHIRIRRTLMEIPCVSPRYILMSPMKET